MTAYTFRLVDREGVTKGVMVVFLMPAPKFWSKLSADQPAMENQNVISDGEIEALAKSLADLKPGDSANGSGPLSCASGDYRATFVDSAPLDRVISRRMRCRSYVEEKYQAIAQSQG